VNKQRSHRFYTELFSNKKLNEVEGKEKYHFEITNIFTPLEDLDTEMEINSAWEIVHENIKI
jgi:hypothetical protein